MIKNNDIEWILREFIEKDQQLTTRNKIRHSVLLSAKRDLKFLRGIDFRNTEYNLDKKIIQALESKLPSFAVILVFSSVIDLVCRVSRGKIPNNKNGKYFRWSARRWFHLSKSASMALWNFRNSMSHQYTLSNKATMIPFGTTGVVVYDKKAKRWIFNLNAMYSSVIKVIPELASYIRSLSISTQRKKLEFIYKYGFFYTNSN